jgi:hypothetical protein
MRTNKVFLRKILLIVLLLSLTVLTACAGGSRAARCTDGEYCQFYTGNRGIITLLERPPRTLFFRSDLTHDIEANFQEFNIFLRNDGASDSLGAVFFSGVSSDSFEIWRMFPQGPQQVMVPRTQQRCNLDIFNVGGDPSNVLSWNFMANCIGVTLLRTGSPLDGTDKTNVKLGPEFFRSFGALFGWSETFLSNAQIELRGGEVTQFSLGASQGSLRFGRSLMLMVGVLDFESLGGMAFYMKGDNPEFPGGDIDYKTFRLRAKGPWPAGQDYYDLNYNIKTCYAYTTFVSPMICIDPDPFSQETKVCNDYTYSWRGSQGAPVAVTNLRQTNTGNEVVIEFDIRNVGPGTIWDVGYLEHCSPYHPGTVTPVMKNVVYIGYMHLDNKLLDCGNYFKIRLNERGDARLTCRYDLLGTDYVGSAYTSPLRLELWYGYEENLINRIQVRRMN